MMFDLCVCLWVCLYVRDISNELINWLNREYIIRIQKVRKVHNGNPLSLSPIYSVPLPNGNPCYQGFVCPFKDILCIYKQIHICVYSLPHFYTDSTPNILLCIFLNIYIYNVYRYLWFFWTSPVIYFIFLPWLQRRNFYVGESSVILQLHDIPLLAKPLFI